MSFNEYVKYMVQRFTKLLDTPAEERQSRKTDPSDEPNQAIYTTRWLGLLPFAWKVFFNKAD
ncbi:hypothetical protein GCM10008983_20900 [Lentibacillus halophilus]|uniref:YqzE family protein n=1 Tax=Lentibacillus halophilus TaxID=295065 RepID=A0ABN0ZDC5_9BACI